MSKSNKVLNSIILSSAIALLGACGGGGGGGGVAGVFAASAGGTQSSDINVLDALVARIRRAPGLLGSGASGVGPAAVVQINSEPCDSGTFSGSFNDADNDQDLSTGDSCP